MPNTNRIRFRIPDDCGIREDTPMNPETVADLCFEYNNLLSYDLLPPQDRAEFMDWYLARRLEVSGGMSSRDVRAAMRHAEEVWRFVSGEINTPTRNQLWSRTYINSLDRRKGNAVVAVTIRC